MFKNLRTGGGCGTRQSKQIFQRLNLPGTGVIKPANIGLAVDMRGE